MPLTLTNVNNPYERTLNTTLPVGQTVYIYLTGQVANTRSCAGSYLNTGTLTYIVNNLSYTGHDVVNFVVPSPSVNSCKQLDLHGSSVIIPDDSDGNYR